MSLAANPNYRLITAPPAQTGEPSAPLPPFQRLVRLAGFLLAFILMVFFLSDGTMESRVIYLFAFLVPFINPVWGIYTIALMGPLFLTDQSNHHLLATLEVLAVGMISGELRLLGRPVVDLDAHGRVVNEDNATPQRIHWGLWPLFLVALSLMLLASSIPGIQLVLHKERTSPRGVSAIGDLLGYIFFGPTTCPEWALKSLWNWLTSMAIAAIVARRANPLVVARFLKLGGVSLLVACLFGLLEWKGLIGLEQIRRVNPDPLQSGRLQGPAGHPGWFGQWIVMMWPGLLLWWSAGRTKRNALVAAALCLVGITLVATAARAAWLGVMVASAFGCLYALSTFPGMKKRLLVAGAVAIGVVLLGVVLGGDVLLNRLIHLLRTDDRANYYVTGLLFLREHPFGIGLGTHYRFYDWLITPYYLWSQMDHVDSHSLWLQTLIENGPFVPAMLLAGVIGIGAEVRKTSLLLDPGARTIMVSAGLALLGLLTVSIAQYLPYIRVIEICAWISAGAVIGLCRKRRCRVGEPVESWGGRRILLVCGCCALLTASMNVGNVHPASIPRSFDRGTDGTLQFWTGETWRTPVNRDVSTVSFDLYRAKIPASVTIEWPDGRIEHLNLPAEGYRHFVYTQDPEEDHWTAPPRYLTIRATPLWTPAEFDPASTDNRQLGVYVSAFRMTAPLRVAAGLPELRY